MCLCLNPQPRAGSPILDFYPQGAWLWVSVSVTTLGYSAQIPPKWPFKAATHVRIVPSKCVNTANLLPLLRKSMSRANPSSDLSAHAASPLGLWRLQPGQKVMGIELRLSRAPGFVISKGPGRFQALSVHAMSWHLTHKVALVLAYLQAADSNCQQRGENEWSGTEAEILLLHLGKHGIPHCWGVLSLLTLSEHQDLCYRESRRLSLHSLLLYCLQLCSGHREILKTWWMPDQDSVWIPKTAMTQIASITESKEVSHFSHAIHLFFQKINILLCTDTFCISYSEQRHWKPQMTHQVTIHNLIWMHFSQKLEADDNLGTDTRLQNWSSPTAEPVLRAQDRCRNALGRRQIQPSMRNQITVKKAAALEKLGCFWSIQNCRGI